MSDIAQKSGVSTSTGSLVLRNKPGIPPETRQRVQKVAQQVGYRPRTLARSHLVSVRLHSLGLIVKSEPGVTPLTNPFYSHVLAGIEESCRQKKINLLYAAVASSLRDPAFPPTSSGNACPARWDKTRTCLPSLYEVGRIRAT